MRRLLRAAREYVLWFLRGIADSDCSVNVRNRAVVITSSPNTHFFLDIFRALGVRTDKWFSYGAGYVGVRAKDAYEIRLFNPEISTYKDRLLKLLATADTYPHRWPNWLEAKVSQLFSEGYDCRSVRDILLSRYSTYVKLKTLKSKSTPD